MQTHLTSGAHHGRTRRLYVWGLSRSKCKRRNRLALRAIQPPVTPTQARLTVGGPRRGHDASLAPGRQKRRWSPRLNLGCRVVCALDGLNGREKSARPRSGSLRGRKCRGTGIHWAQKPPPPQIWDPSNIARGYSALGKDGVEEVNALILHVAKDLGFADISILSSD